MSADGRFKAALLAEIPQLRFFARSLTGDADRADDLVQDTLIKAWAAAERFPAESAAGALRRWLFVIMRNQFYSDHRKRRREAPGFDAAIARFYVHPEQPGRLDLADLRKALDALPADQREALLLVGASGFSYDEAAKICDCAVGTVKSRINRARKRLAEILGVRAPDEFGDEFLGVGALADIKEI